MHHSNAANDVTLMGRVLCSRSMNLDTFTDNDPLKNNRQFTYCPAVIGDGESTVGSHTVPLSADPIDSSLVVAPRIGWQGQVYVQTRGVDERGGLLARICTDESEPCFSGIAI